MRLTINVNGEAPEIAARLIRAQAEEKLASLRAELKEKKLVFVRAHVRTGPPKWFASGDPNVPSRVTFSRWAAASEAVAAAKKEARHGG